MAKQLANAEDELKAAVDAAKNAKTKPEIEKALKKRGRCQEKDRQPQETNGRAAAGRVRISYTTKLPKEYEEKNPFDLVYDAVSGKLCPKSSKLQWDGSILSCQKGDNPGGGDRPIPPATDIAPNDPNRR